MKQKVDEKSLLFSSRFMKQKEYWKTKLSGDLPALFLFEGEPGGVPPTRRQEQEIFIPADLSRLLIKRSKKSDLSIYIILLAGIKSLAARYTGQEDMVVVSPLYAPQVTPHTINNRLFIRDRFNKDITFKELLLKIRQSVLEAYENQDYPSDKLVEGKDFIPGISCSLRNIHGEDMITANSAAICFSFVREGERLKGKMVYYPGLYQKHYIKQISKHLTRILEISLEQVEIPISRISFLSKEEKRQLLWDFNTAPGEYPREKLIFELFEEVKEKMPDNIALVHGDQQFTYRELNKRANRTARVLRSGGVGPGSIAAIMVEPSLYMLAGILGILKAGAAYLPIDPGYPRQRILFMLADSAAAILLTSQAISKRFSFTALKGFSPGAVEFKVTAPRPQVKHLDDLPIPDRTLVDYKKYHQYIGEALAKHTMTMQATRGCPYQCAFCHKIWPKKHVYRSAENIFNEIKTLYDVGIRRFVFVDDIFNLNEKNASRLFKLIISNQLKVQLFFTNGLRGDVLTRDLIDLMVEAGTVDFDFSLESGSPRIQQLIRKDLNLEKLKETIDYILKIHPRVIVELQTMLGFPTESEEEAMMTLDFIKSLKWVDFPYVHFLRIYPETDMAKIALENGISAAAIENSSHLAFHEYSETMPFSREFARLYQTKFFDEYFLLKERLLAVLRKQMKILTQDEIIRKYDSFLPTEIKSFSGLLKVLGISDQALATREFLDENAAAVPGINEKLAAVFPGRQPNQDALRLLLLDLSQFFSRDADVLYDVVEAPLGLMYLLTYLHERYGGKINGKVAKSRIDFDNYKELYRIITEFKPGVIGIRTLSYYKDFFHRTISMIRQWEPGVPIIAGGPYATSSYPQLLKDNHVDVVVLGEGEITFAEIIGKVLENRGKLPGEEVLKELKGIAFIENKNKSLKNRAQREVIFPEEIDVDEPGDNINPGCTNNPADLAYVIYTSGSTGAPKGVMVEHGNLSAYINAFNKIIKITPRDVIIQQASFSFDTYVEEVYPVLLKGGKIAAAEKYEILDMKLLSQFILKYNVNIIDCSPLLLNQLNKIAPLFHRHDYTFISGGDVLKKEYVNNLLKAGAVYNSYGPTETTVCATYYKCSGQDPAKPPIGKPLRNYELYILDPRQALVPIGVPGELCIAGAGVTRGYLNNPALTAEKFNHDGDHRSYKSYRSYIPPKLYRTGDRARWLVDGNIEFLGRIDQQVKVRGYRIEPGEIENKLLKCKDIKNAVVVAKEDESRGKYICAYFEAYKEKNSRELSQFLSGELPDYMIPSRFVQLSKIPVTVSGKIDIKLLSDRHDTVVGPGVDYIAPGSEIEKKIARIWQDIFKGKPIGIDDNFFQLGGDSLLVIQSLARMREELSVEFSLQDFFEAPVIRVLAAEVERLRREVVRIKPGLKTGKIPLSFAQERIWFLQQLDRASRAYHVPRALRLKGNLDKGLLEQALTEVIRRHDILRTVFPLVDGEPEQRILEPYEFKIPLMDLSDIEEEQQSKKVSELIIKEGQLEFDLEKGPLLRVTLWKLKDEEHLLILTEHHLIHDGWTQGVLLKEFIAVFSGLKQGNPPQLLPLPIQYADYAIWQRNFLQGEVLERHLDYWRKKLADLTPILNLPTDHPRPQVFTGQGDEKRLFLSRELSADLEEFSRQKETTLFMTMLVVFKVLLYRYSGISDLCVGTGTANRRYKEMEGMLGMVINTLPLRTRITGESSFEECLKRVKTTCLEAYEHEDTPFGKIVEAVRPERSLSYTPIFQVMFNFMDIPEVPLHLPGLEIQVEPAHNRSAKFDLNIIVQPPSQESIEENHREIEIMWEYSTDIFNDSTAGQMLRHYKRLLEESIKFPGEPVSVLPMLEKPEVRQLLYDFNRTLARYPRDKTIHRLFADQVEKTPDNIAVVGPLQMKYRTDMTYITYRELNDKSNHLAMLLQAKGVRPDTIAGIMVERSIEMIIGILGILKAGGAYMPIDPEYPEERIDFMLKDSNARLIIKKSEIRNPKSETNPNDQNSNDQNKKAAVTVLDFEHLNFEFVSNFEIRASNLSTLNLAYIIYTSGSTGRPKGVMIEHRSVVRLLFNDKFPFDFNDRDVWTLFHSYCFDFSVWEMYGALLYGGKLIIITKMEARDPARYRDFLGKYQVTVLNQTPSAFFRLIPEELNPPHREEKKLHLRYVIFGGEALKPLKLKEWKKKYPGTLLVNMYGITETTVHATYKEISDKEIEVNKSNIGQPIPTLSIYIMDHHLRLVPIGVRGELCIGGGGVARGYLNQPELTFEKFLPDFYKSYIYRSGDLARWRENGDIEYLGRRDQQVKVRGFRVELGEIENVLLTHEAIKETVVMANARGYLQAYISADKELAAVELKTYLSGKLPDYMVPAYFIPVDKIPVTPNGKIDRKALLEVDVIGISLPGKIDTYAAAATEREKQLAEIWEQFLGWGPVGVNVNFFNAGGDSIRAINLVHLINKRLSAHLSIPDLYLQGTIKELARKIDQTVPLYAPGEREKALKEIQGVENRVMESNLLGEGVEDVYPMSAVQEGMVFYSLKEPGSGVYHDQMVHQVKIPGFNPEIFTRAFALMVEKHPVLRTAFNLEDYEMPVQLVYKYKHIPFDTAHYTISHMERGRQEEYLNRFLLADRKAPFNLGTVPLWRLRTFDLGNDKICILLVAHHAILDGWSVASLAAEWLNTYEALTANPAFVPEKLKNSYKEFILEQWIEKKSSRGVNFWRNELADYKRFEFPVAVEIPADNKNDDERMVKIYNYRPGKGLFSRLQDTAKRFHSTVKNICFGAYVYMLNMLSYESDMLVGLVTHHRPVCEDGDKILGCFLNTMPVRVDITPGITWLDYMSMVDRKLRELKIYERTPFLEILRITGESTEDRNPLFDTLFNFIDFHIYRQLDDHWVRYTGEELHLQGRIITNTLLDFSVNITFGEFDLDISYDGRAVNDATVKRLCHYFERVLHKCMDEPGGIARKDELLPVEEKQKLLYDFNRTQAQYPQDKTIHRLFARQVEKTPNNIAVVGPLQMKYKTYRTYMTYITYRELNDKSNHLALLLQAKGVQSDTIAAIMVERSIEMIIGILGILKAGGAYLPIDPDYPQDRIDYMLKDSGAKILLTSQEIPGPSSIHPSTLLPFYPSHSSSLAYIIYTSGSTGRPKGVMIEHWKLVNLCFWHHRYFEVTDRDHASQYVSIGFDASVWEIFPYLIKGACLFVVNEDMRLDLEKLNIYFEKNDITIGFLPTPVCEQFTKMKNRSLRLLLTGGDKLRVFNRTTYRFFNTYGPTENTVVATIFLVEKDYENIPIGRPLDNNYIYILSITDQQLQPVGVPGELCIGGDGVARGYLNNPELTAEKFLPVFYKSYKSYRSYISKRIYRTGDLARWLPDGNIEFQGRVDQQVKIRGFRIELGEIESQLLTHHHIKEAVVISRPGSGESKEHYLCAYIIAKRKAQGTGRGEASLTVNSTELRAFLAKKLPDYMIPAYFVSMDRIPLTPNGKVDKKALPGPEFKPGENYVAPRNTLERKLVETWSEILGLESNVIGIDNNFFHLGGHSIGATILASRIHKRVKVKIPLSEIFKTPTIKGLSEYIKKAEEDRYASIAPAEKKDYYALSSAQKRLYVLQQRDLNGTAYNLPQTIPIEEPDIERLEKIFKKLIYRHESLRTSFHLVEDQPVQRVHQEIRSSVLEGTRGLAPLSTELAADTIRKFIRPFDLSQAPLLRVGLIKQTGNQYVLLIDMHHIITDGTSQAVLKDEFESLLAGKDEELPPLKLHYKDFSRWQNSREQQARVKDQETYWLNMFSFDEIPVLNLPFDFPRSLVQRFAGSSVGFALNEEETKLLTQQAKETNTTLYMFILSAFYVLLSKLSGQEDIIMGTPTAARCHTDLERIIGMFVNTLVLRNTPSGEKTFKEFLQEVKARTVEAFDNQEYQFEDLVDKISVPRETSRNPLFDVMFNLLHQVEYTRGDHLGEIGQQHSFKHIEGTSKFDLTLTAIETVPAERLLFSLEYSTELFTPGTIERIIAYFKKILYLLSKNPDRKISGIEIIPDPEKQRILYEFNDTGSGYPWNKTIHELFAEQVERTPDHVALMGQIPNKEVSFGQVLNAFGVGHLSYKELNEKANQLAHLLLEKGLKPDNMVGIMTGRSVEMVIGMLGILKAAGAYMPIDPDYPEERIQYMLTDSSARFLVTTIGLSEKFEKLSIVNCQLLIVNEIPPNRQRLNNPPKEANSINNLQLKVNNLAYIIYTSGTTGRPKGTLIRHRNVVRLMQNDRFPFDFNENDSWTMFHSYCFDFSVWEMYGALLYGGKLIIITKMEARDPARYRDILVKYQVTILNQTPSAFYRLIDEELNQPHRKEKLHLRYVIFGGEALSPVKLKEWGKKYPGTLLVNMYGITETTVHVTYKEISCKEIDDNRSNIGQPIPTLTTYILDHHLKLVPIGVSGELCVGGEGVARGYLNQPELTFEKFVRAVNSHLSLVISSPLKSNDQCPMTNDRLYRSGDLARWRENGDIEYLGRLDHQVKIRGFRVELGEIENFLLKHEGITAAVVIAKEKYLCAYIVSHKGLVVQELMEYLSRHMPDYMIPSYVVKLENLPLTAGGKIDRKALPAPELQPNESYTAPRDMVEEKLTWVWSEVLQVKKNNIGIHDHFFQRGGHSLKAVRLVSRINKEFNVRISLDEIFKKPLLYQMAALITGAEKKELSPIRSVEKKEYYRLSPPQKRLYIHQQLDPEGTFYNMPMITPLEIGTKREKLEEIFKILINRHESLRTSFAMVSDTPVQRVYDCDKINFAIDYFDIKAGEQEIGRRKPEKIIANFERPFDLSAAPLLRAGLIKTSGKIHLFLVDMHHIISDGTSQDILRQEFQALLSGEELVPIRLQYKDYSVWQNSETHNELIKQQEAYWLKEFLYQKEIPVLNLPIDYPRPQEQSFKGSMIRFELNEKETRILKELAKETGATLYMCLFSIYTVLLVKLSGQEDIIVGTPTAARRQADLEHIIGMFVNTLAIRNYPTGEKIFKEFLFEVKEHTLEAFENQEYPFDDLVEKVLDQRDASRSPLFDVMFAFHNQAVYSKDNNNNAFIPPQEKDFFERDIKRSLFDLILHGFESGEILGLAFEYNTKLFKDETIKRFIDYFRDIIKAVTENKYIRLKDIKISHGLLKPKSEAPGFSLKF